MGLKICFAALVAAMALAGCSAESGATQEATGPKVIGYSSHFFLVENPDGSLRECSLTADATAPNGLIWVCAELPPIPN